MKLKRLNEGYRMKYRIKYRVITEVIWKLFFLAGGLIICVPIFFLITGSVMSNGDLEECLGPVLREGKGLATWKLIPQYPTFVHYKELLVESPGFYVLFWNSVKMTLLILAGQLVVGIPAAWAFAIYQNRFSKVLFSIYVILMLMPFQVTMLPSYLVLCKLSLLNTIWAVVLPGIFSTFPVFLIYGGFRQIPKELLEAARMDGASEMYLLWHVGIPLGKQGIFAMLVLGFLEYFNMIEQPMVFLEKQALWPLSLYLPDIGLEQSGIGLCASLVMLIPALFVFLLGQDYLEQGITYVGIK